MDLSPYRAKLFGDRDTLDEALQYAYTIADASENPSAVMTAVYVVLNTAINLTTPTDSE